jgi:L-malate glycosyltransferase
MGGDEVKILVVASTGSPWSYGVIEDLQAAGATVRLLHVSPEPGTSYIDPQSPEWLARKARLEECCEAVIPLDPGAGLGRVLNLTKAMKKQFALGKCDWILTLYGGKFALAAMLTGIKNTAVFYVGSDTRGGSTLGAALTQLAQKRAGANFFNGESILPTDTRNTSKNHLLYLGIHPARFPVGNPEASPIRMICTRGFSTVYDNETIVRALAQLPSEPEWRFTFAAGGDLLERCKSLWEEIATPEIRGRVEFLGGVSPIQIATLLAQSQLYLSMSLSDGASTSLLEALASGCFPIVSDIPANAPWVSEDHRVAKCDSKALATRFQLAFTQLGNWNRVTNPMRARVLAEADSRQNMKRLIEILERS